MRLRAAGQAGARPRFKRAALLRSLKPLLALGVAAAAAKIAWPTVVRRAMVAAWKRITKTV